MNNPNKVQETGDDLVERKNEKHTPSITVFITGSFSAVVCSILLQPLDVLKTRLQNPVVPKKGKRKNFGLLSLLVHIYKHENIKVLWYGTSATIFRGIPAGGLYFCVYDWLKMNIFNDNPPTTIQHISLAMTARALTDIAIIPLTVVKTRIESGVFKYDNVVLGLTYIYRQEGLAGLTSGLLPVLARDIPMSGTYIFFYNQTQGLLPTALHESHGHIVHSTCAGVSAILSALITHPPDALKTQMQLYPKKYPNVVTTIKKTYLEYGIKGYFHGLLPRYGLNMIYLFFGKMYMESASTLISIWLKEGVSDDVQLKGGEPPPEEAKLDETDKILIHIINEKICLLNLTVMKRELQRKRKKE